jgi:predicted O-methyltransferase YrrM
VDNGRCRRLDETDHPECDLAGRRVRVTIERLVSTGTAVARSDSTRHDLFPLAVSAAEGEALRRWVVREEATRTVEVGLGYAISALHVCEGLLAHADAGARHVVIDPLQESYFSGCGLQFLEEAGVLGLVEHHAEESQIALPRLLHEGRSFDFAFVDGNHRFDGVFTDLFYLGRLVRQGEVVFLDDYQLPAVGRAASFFVRNLGWAVEEVSAWDDFHRWAVLRTSDSPDTRPYDYYVDF